MVRRGFYGLNFRKGLALKTLGDDFKAFLFCKVIQNNVENQVFPIDIWISDFDIFFCICSGGGDNLRSY